MDFVKIEENLLNGLSPEDTEKALVLLAKGNTPHFFKFLQDDLRLKGGLLDPSEFVEFPARFAVATLYVFHFLIRKGGWLDSKADARIEVACRIFSVFYTNCQLLMLPNRKCFMRRDCAWIYFSAIVHMFVENVRTGTISLVGENHPVSLEEMRRLCSLVPPEWIESAHEPRSFLKVAESFCAGVPPSDTPPLLS